MRAARLRHRLVIETFTETQDGTGHPVKDWETFAEVWGGIEPGKSVEVEKADQIITEQTTNMPIRYLEGIDNEMRVRWYDERAAANRYYRILDIKDTSERHREMLIVAVKVGLSDFT